MESYNPMYLLSIIPLVVGYVVYFTTGYVGKVRLFTKPLKTKKKESQIAPEILRQLFIEKYPEYKSKDTQVFLKTAKKFLKYKEKDEDFEDGSFWINPECEYASKPKPTKEMPYVPPGFY